MIGNYIEQGRQSLLKRDIQKIRGTETGTVVSMNRRYIDSIMLEMRMIDAVPDPDTTCSFLGREFATPVMSGALSGLNNIRPHGMAVLARGMADADACMWAGIGQETELREILATGVPTVKIIKPYKDHDKIFEKIDMALMAGMELDGSEGVTKVVKGITEELRRIMGQTGCTSLKDIDPSILWVDL